MTVSLSVVQSRSARDAADHRVHTQAIAVAQQNTWECASKQGQRHKEYDLIPGLGLCM
jgi:uncharacterized protein (DUF736 family)